MMIGTIFSLFNYDFAVIDKCTLNDINYYFTIQMEGQNYTKNVFYFREIINDNETKLVEETDRDILAKLATIFTSNYIEQIEKGDFYEN